MYLSRFFNSVIGHQTVHYTRRYVVATVTKMIFYPFQSRCILEVASILRKCGYYVISIQQEDGVSICRKRPWYWMSSAQAARNTHIIFPALIFVTILTTFVTAGELV